MAQRSLNQNNFYHMIVSQAYKEVTKQHLTILSLDRFRDELKKLDINYPRYNVDDHGVFYAGKPMSSTKIDTQQMMNHTEFIIDLMSAYNISLKYVEDEWERTMKLAHK